MNNLQLVQETWRLLGHEDDKILDVADNDGIKGDVIKAVNDAWHDVQRERMKDWKFTRTKEIFDTTAYKTNYVVGTDIITADSSRGQRTIFGEWDIDMILYDDTPVPFFSHDYFVTTFNTDPYRLYFENGSSALTAGLSISGSVSLETAEIKNTATVTSGTYGAGTAVGYVDITNLSGDWDATDGIIIGAGPGSSADVTSISRPSGNKPQAYTIDPATDTLILNWLDDAYTVHAWYRKTLDSLVLNGDIPTGLPSRFHMLIVYTALEDLGIKFGAREILDFYGRKRKHVLGQLLRSENPAKNVRKRPIVK